MRTAEDSHHQYDHASQPAPPPGNLRILTGATVFGVLISLLITLALPQTDVTQGEVQRIFYIHAPSFFGAFLAYGCTFIGGVMFLRTRQSRWDHLALAGVEIGLTFSLIYLTTGIIWARSIWDAWWTWDPRLSSAAIMTLTYAAYLMLRSGVDNVETRRRFASAYGIIALLAVVISLLVIRLIPESIHFYISFSPLDADDPFTASSRTIITLGINLVVWSILLPITLMWHCMRLENLTEYINIQKLNSPEN